MSKVIITIAEVRETPTSKPRVVLDLEHKGKINREADYFNIAMKAIDFIDTERRKL